MKKIKWLKPPDGLRKAGQVEENDDWLCDAWVKAGLAEPVSDDAKTHAETLAEDLERRLRPVESPDAKAMHESPVDRAMKPKESKKR